MAIIDRIKTAWNAFRSDTPVEQQIFQSTANYSQLSGRNRLPSFNERSIIESIYTRLAIDVASVEFRHIQLDESRRYKDDVNSDLNTVLTFSPNLDQGPRDFRQDIAMTMFSEGLAAIVPVDTTVDPKSNLVFDIQSVRVGVVRAWHPKHVRVDLYNEETGRMQEVTVEKRTTALIQNPFFTVMNQQNSTLKRLLRKLTLLDSVDEATNSGKLDLIIQLPYVVKNESKKIAAEQRAADIEEQLRANSHGIAYIDGVEKITQLNRPIENSLLKQIEYLTEMLYGQLGLTKDIMNGTATPDAMDAYFDRTIEPIIDSIVEGMQKAFIGPVGNRKNERIRYYSNPFRFIAINNLAEVVDKFTRNEVMSSNEVRGYMGMPPSNDPKADELRNSNMPHPDDAVTPTNEDADVDDVNSSFDEADALLGGLIKDVEGMLN